MRTWLGDGSRVARACGAIAVAIGALVLLGWSLDFTVEIPLGSPNGEHGDG